MARRSGYTSQQPRVTGPGDVDRLRREVELGLGSIALAVAQLTAATAAADAGVGGDVAALADAPVVLTAADADFPNHRILAVGSPITLAVGAPLGNALIDFDETVALGNNARVTLRKNSGANVGTRRRVNLIEGANISLTLADDAGDEEVDVTVATTGVAGIDAAYVTIGNDGSLTAERALTGSTSILITDNGANSSVVLSLIDEYLDDRVAALLVEGHGIDLVYDDGAGSLTIAVDEAELDESLLDHGSLGGLADQADHTWALTIDGTRPLTGAWAVGAQDITGIDDLSGKAATLTGTGIVTLNLSGAFPRAQMGSGADSTSWAYLKAEAGECYNAYYSAGQPRWQFPYITSDEAARVLRYSAAGAQVNYPLIFDASDTLGATATTLADSTINMSAASVTRKVGDGTGTPSDHYNKGAAGEYYGELISGSTREWLFPYFRSNENLAIERWTGGAGINAPLEFVPSATQAAAITVLGDGFINMNYGAVALTLGGGTGSISETLDADGTGTGTLSFLKDSAVTSGKRLTHDTGEDLSIESHNGSAWLQVAEIDDADHTWQFHRQWNTPWTTYAPGGTTQTIDWNDGNLVVLDVGDASGNVTLTLSNPNDGAIYHVLMTQDSAGPDTFDVVWPGNVTWPGGTAPVLTSSGDDTPYDLVKLVYHLGLDLYFATFDQHFV